MASFERNPGKPARATFYLLVKIEIPDRARSHRKQIKPLDIQSYLPKGAFRMVIFPMRALNLALNSVCLVLLSPYRNGDVNMSSSWECSRNDVIEGVAVIGAAAAVWAFQSGWPDIIVAIVLLVIFLRSATRVLRNARRELTPATA